MRETEIEKKLKIYVEARGGKCKKFVSPGSAGEPDRICLFPGGRITFVEIKSPGEKPRPLQVKQHQELRSLGFDVRVIDSEDQIEEVMPK